MKGIRRSTAFKNNILFQRVIFKYIYKICCAKGIGIGCGVASGGGQLAQCGAILHSADGNGTGGSSQARIPRSCGIDGSKRDPGTRVGNADLRCAAAGEGRIKAVGIIIAVKRFAAVLLVVYLPMGNTPFAFLLIVTKQRGRL